MTYFQPPDFLLDFVEAVGWAVVAVLASLGAFLIFLCVYYGGLL